MASLDKLPDEILLKIFSYLSIDDLVLSVRNVCTRWRAVSEDDETWNNRTYFPKASAPKEEIMFMLENMPALRKFQYCGIHNIIGKLSECCKKVRVLIIPNTKLNAILLKLTMDRLTELSALHILIAPTREAPILTYVIGQSKTLLNLILRSTSRKTQLQGLLRPIADGCPNLKTLKFEVFNCPNSEICYLMKCKKDQLEAYGHYGHMSAELITVMNECTNLKSLAFLDIDIKDKADELPPMTQLQNLNMLQVSYCRIPVVHKILLRLLINALPRLTYIGIPYTLGNIDIIANEIVLNCPLLTYLDLEGNDELHCRALRNIRSCKLIKYLDVSRCTELNVEAMQYVAESCPDLQNLDVSGIPMSEGVFRQILRCRNLKTLLMKDCDLGQIDLNLIITNISGLSYLSIGPRFQLPNDAINVMKKAMPKLVIKQASCSCDGSEYFGIKTDFIPLQF
jgi:hypothetical protein